MSLRRHRLLLLLIVAAGTAIRIWYAAWGLDAQRFWDERYSFENVTSILETGSLEPAKVYYPSPLVSWPQAGLLAASDALHRLTGNERLAIRGRYDYSATAYLLVRLLSVAYGVAALPVLFLVGRYVFSPQVGLLAALALAFVPWHVHASGKFKPDALLVLTVLLAFHWSLRAVRQPSAGRYVLAGIGIALALSSKITGGIVGLPLAAGALIAGRGERWRRLGGVALAAAVSLGVFLALNPYGRWYLGFVGGLQEDYAMRAGWAEMTRGAIPLRTLEYLMGDFVHGPAVGALALLGALALAISLLGRPVLSGGSAVQAAGGPRWYPSFSARPSFDRAQRAMLLLFPVAFTAAYAYATPYFKGNNFLPIVPFTSLFAAWLGWRLWKAAGRRLPRLRRRTFAAPLAAAVVVLLVAPGFRYVYRSLTPTGLDVARDLVSRESQPPPGRFYYLEPHDPSQPPWEGRDELARRRRGFREVETLGAVEPRRLDLADGEVFSAARLEGDAADPYRRRFERVPEERRSVVRPRPFAVRAPAGVALVHRRRLAATVDPPPAGRCSGRNCFVVPLPDELPAPALLSIEVALEAQLVETGQTQLPLEVDGEALDTVLVVLNGPHRTFLTERFRAAGDALELLLPGVEPRLLRRRVGIRLYVWEEPGGG